MADTRVLRPHWGRVGAVLVFLCLLFLCLLLCLLLLLPPTYQPTYIPTTSLLYVCICACICEIILKWSSFNFICFFTNKYNWFCLLLCKLCRLTHFSTKIRGNYITHCIASCVLCHVIEVVLPCLSSHLVPSSTGCIKAWSGSAAL